MGNGQQNNCKSISLQRKQKKKNMKTRKFEVE